MKCECCHKSLKGYMPNQKRCNACAIYVKNLVKMNGALRRQIKTLRIKIYGQKNGWERIR